MAIVDELVSILGYEIKGEANLKRFENQLNHSAKRVETLTKRIAAYGAAADRAFELSRKMAIPSALAVLYSKRIKDASLQTEGWAQGFKAVTGSVAGANDELAFAEERADRYGANLVKVTQNWLKFRAATNGTELSDQAREIFETFTAVSVTLGQTPDQLDGALKAVEQMVSKGKVQAEELRGQLGERVYGAFLKAAESMGITTAELDKMLEQGQVVASDLLPKLAKQLQEDYSINLGDRIDTDIATFARLENSLFKLRVAIGRSGFIDFLASMAEELTKLIRIVSEANPMMLKFAGTFILLTAAAAPLLWIFGAMAKSIQTILKLGLAFRGLAGAIGAIAIAKSGGKLIKFLSFFRKHKEVITALKVLRFAFLALSAPIWGTVAAIAAIGLGLNDLWHFMRGGESVIGSFVDWFKKTNFSELGESIGGGIVEGIESFTANIDATVQKVTDTMVATLTNPEFYKAGAEIAWALLKGIRDVAKALAKAVFDLVVGIFFGIVDKIAGFDVREAGIRLAANILNAIADGWASLKERAVGVFSSISDWLLDVPFFQMGVDAMSNMFDGMKSIGGRIKAWFADLLPEWASDYFKTDSGFATQNQNLSGNLEKVDGRKGLATGSIANISNRASQKISNEIKIEQNVSQPTQAPGQLAKATGAALSKVMPERAQLNIEATQP